ncbi:hypothetical protein [Reinekea sp. G2M2-21]|uniref:hypothetical protein n=1 Tax=Reinekea sp. G2M2-21 TaxID=2788942 RepID=UPI0018AC250E|nr:hypothetical protein [Reinekea sp. G2M2-21]
MSHAKITKNSITAHEEKQARRKKRTDEDIDLQKVEVYRRKADLQLEREIRRIEGLDGLLADI